MYCRTLNLFLFSSIPNKSLERIEGERRGKKSKIIMRGRRRRVLREAKRRRRQRKHMLCLQLCLGGLISGALKELKAGVFENLP